MQHGRTCLHAPAPQSVGPVRASAATNLRPNWEAGLDWKKETSGLLPYSGSVLQMLVMVDVMIGSGPTRKGRTIADTG